MNTSLKNCLGILPALFFNQRLMHSSYYDMVPVLIVPWLRPADEMKDYCYDKYDWWLYWQCSEGLVMTLMTTGEGHVMTQVMTLKWPGWPKKDLWLPCNDPFDKLVTTLKFLMMTPDDIWWPQLATFITKIESCLSCRLLFDLSIIYISEHNTLKMWKDTFQKIL